MTPSGQMRRPIIGVYGEDNSATIPLADALGAAITRKGGILLTSGKPHIATGNALKKVRDVAMSAALTAGTPQLPARLISVLDDTEPSKETPCITTLSTDSWRMVILQTGLTPHQRCVVSGAVPDAAVALLGGIETLAEVCFARLHGVPTVFLGSQGAFTKIYSLNIPAFTAILSEARDRYPVLREEAFKVSKVNAEFAAYLNDPRTPYLPPAGNHAGDAANALASAVKMASAATSYSERYPGIPPGGGHSAPPTRATFSAEIARIAI